MATIAGIAKAALFLYLYTGAGLREYLPMSKRK